VWYDDGATGEFDLPVGAVVKSADAGQVVITTVDGDEKWVKATDETTIRVMHPTSATGVEDMIKLGDLHEVGGLPAARFILRPSCAQTTRTSAASRLEDAPERAYCSLLFSLCPVHATTRPLPLFQGRNLLDNPAVWL